MSDRTLDWEFPNPWPYEGIVIRRDDPFGLGRVTANIPGEIDETAWLLPMGNPGAGAQDHGAIIVPPIGADILIQYVQGDAENGRYTPAHHGTGEAPTGTAITADGDNIVWRDKRVQIEVDSRTATYGVRVTDKATGLGVSLDLDMAGRQVKIHTALGVEIISTGLVKIVGGTVLINGRPVSPVGPPI